MLQELKWKQRETLLVEIKNVGIVFFLIYKQV